MFLTLTYTLFQKIHSINYCLLFCSSFRWQKRPRIFIGRSRHPPSVCGTWKLTAAYRHTFWTTCNRSFYIRACLLVRARSDPLAISRPSHHRLRSRRQSVWKSKPVVIMCTNTITAYFRRRRIVFWDQVPELIRVHLPAPLCHRNRPVSSVRSKRRAWTRKYPKMVTRRRVNRPKMRTLRYRRKIEDFAVSVYIFII